jgi:uncharacterized membrane protein
MMDKATYLAELAKALDGLSATDRQNTLAYYNEFLNDAESEGEVDASALLGSPHTLAAQIKADIAMEGIDAQGTSGIPVAIAAPAAPNTFGSSPTGFGAPGGSGVAPGGFTPGAPNGVHGGAPGGIPNTAMPTAPPPHSTGGGAPKSGLGVVWTVILAILAIPIGVPLAIAVIALVFAVFVTLISLFFALGAVVVGFLATGILSWIVGFLLLFSDFSIGLFYLGIGFAAAGLCLLCGMAFWRLGKLSVKGIARLFNAIRKKLARRERGAQ